MNSSYLVTTLIFISFLTQGTFAKTGASPKVGSPEYIKQENAATAKLGYGEPIRETSTVITPTTNTVHPEAGDQIPTESIAANNDASTATGDWSFGAAKSAPQMSYAPGHGPLKILSNESTPASKAASSENVTGPVSPGSPLSTAVQKGNVELETARGPSGVETELNCEIADSAPETIAARKAYAAACQEVKTIDKSCFAVFEQTNKWCHTEQNESIATSITMIQSLMSVASGVTNACNNFGKAMNLAKQAMTLYTTACSAAQIACNSKCGGTVKALTKFVSTITEIDAAMWNQTCNPTIANYNAEQLYPQAANVKKSCAAVTAQFKEKIAFAKTEVTPAGGIASVGSKAKICAVSVPAMLGTAIINIGSLAQSKAQSDQCKADAAAQQAAADAEKSCTNVANKDRADCACTIAANKSLSYCATNMVDCGLSENADKPLCICKANPRMKGCEGVSTSLATNSTLNSGSGGGLSSSRNPGSLVNTPSTATDAANFPKSTSGNGQDGVGSAAGGGSGGSSAGLGSSSGGGDAAQKAAEKTASKDSANILESGGAGGGGFRSSGFGGGYSSPDYRSKLKAFASKNGIGAKIAGSSWTDQVTATGGKSNFEKVKTRYQENKSSLLSK